MKAVRALGLAVLFAASASVAQAMELTFPSTPAQEAQADVDDATLAQIADSNEESAADLMSPDELFQERVLDFDFDFMHEKRTSQSTARLYILVDKANRGMSPTAQTMQVYLDGQLIYNFLVSTGRETPEIAKSGRQSFSATPTGRFKIDSRSKNYVSKTWLAPMPYAQFFNGGIAIHATVRSHYAALGSRDSGGCVRLHNDNAKIMWDLVDQVGKDNVVIEVVDNSRR